MRFHVVRGFGSASRHSASAAIRFKDDAGRHHVLNPRHLDRQIDRLFGRLCRLSADPRPLPSATFRRLRRQHRRLVRDMEQLRIFLEHQGY